MDERVSGKTRASAGGPGTERTGRVDPGARS